MTFQIGFALTIEAEDKGNPPMKSQVTLAINVVDVNDNPPIFKKRKYQGFMNNDLTNLRNDLQVSIKNNKYQILEINLFSKNTFSIRLKLMIWTKREQRTVRLDMRLSMGIMRRNFSLILYLVK